jgi:tetratricopeptide (TPR) repeat protein
MTARLTASLLCCAALLAGCTVPMTGADAMRAGDYGAAVTAFEAQAASDSGDWKTRELLGYAYLKNGDAQKAIAEFEKVLAQEPKASMCLVYLGWAQLKLDNQTAALDAWRRFNDPTKPLLKQEMDRLLTLVGIERSKKLARQALAAEAQGSLPPAGDNSYAVFNFAVAGAGSGMAPLQKALTAMIIADLAQIEGVTVIGRTRMQALLDGMRPGSGAADRATALRACRLLGAEKCVLGNMSEAEGRLNIAGSIASAKQGNPLGSFELSEEKTRFFALQKQLLAQIIELNKIKLDPELGSTLLYHFHTLNHEAAVAYGQGLDALDRQDWLAAQDHFSQAAKLDPFFLLARTARDRAPASISLRVGEAPSADALGKRIEAVANAQGISPASAADRAVTPGTVPATALPPTARSGS